MSRIISSASGSRIGILAVALLIVATNGFGIQPDSESPHRIPIATIDIARTFKEYKSFNASLSGIKNEMEVFGQSLKARQEQLQEQLAERAKEFGAPQRIEQAQAELARGLDNLKTEVEEKKKKLLADEAKVYGESYQRMEVVVARICKTRDIGIVLRSQTSEINPNDREKTLQDINRTVIHSAVPDITDDVLAELNR